MNNDIDAMKNQLQKLKATGDNMDTLSKKVVSIIALTDS